MSERSATSVATLPVANGRARENQPRSGLGRLLVFFLLVAATAFALDCLIDVGLRSIKTSAPGALNRVMTGQANAQIVISGSSRALVHYDPRIIHEVTGKTAFNIGRNGSHIDMQVALLKAYLRHNPKPELVIHNLDLHSFQPTKELYDPAQYLPYINDPDIYAAIRRITGEAWKWRYLPLYGYAIEDMRFSWIRGVQALAGSHPREDHFSGYNPRNLSWTGEFDEFAQQNKSGFSVPVEPAGISSVRQLIKLCEEHGVRIVLVYAPEFRAAQQLTSNRAEIFRTFQKIAEERGVPFFDFSHSPICADRNLFYNSQHLNASGATAFTQELAQKVGGPLAVTR